MYREVSRTDVENAMYAKTMLNIEKIVYDTVVSVMRERGMRPSFIDNEDFNRYDYKLKLGYLTYWYEYLEEPETFENVDLFMVADDDKLMCENLIKILYTAKNVLDAYLPVNFKVTYLCMFANHRYYEVMREIAIDITYQAYMEKRYSPMSVTCF